MSDTIEPYPPVIDACCKCKCFKYVLYYRRNSWTVLAGKPICYDCLKGIEDDNVRPSED